MPLMVSISGIRGIVGESLTPEVAVRYSSAFGEYCSKRFHRYTDGHCGKGRQGDRQVPHRPHHFHTSREGGERSAILASAPRQQYSWRWSEQARPEAIAVTASHNPIQWNGMKFVASTGMFLDGDENRELWAIAESAPTYVPWDSLGSYEADDSWIEKHIDAVLSLPYINFQDDSGTQTQGGRRLHQCRGRGDCPTILRRLGIGGGGDELRCIRQSSRARRNRSPKTSPR